MWTPDLKIKSGSMWEHRYTHSIVQPRLLHQILLSLWKTLDQGVFQEHMFPNTSSLLYKDNTFKEGLSTNHRESTTMMKSWRYRNWEAYHELRRSKAKARYKKPWCMEEYMRRPLAYTSEWWRATWTGRNLILSNEDEPLAMRLRCISRCIDRRLARRWREAKQPTLHKLGRQTKQQILHLLRSRMGTSTDR